MKPWGSRHRVLTWLLILVSALFVLTGEAAGVILGLIGIAIAYQLFDRPGLNRKANRQP
jgi:hypothetical protein